MFGRLSPESHRQPRLVAEHLLRNKVIELLPGSDETERTSVAELFNQMMGKSFEADIIFYHIEQAIVEAQLSMGWGNEDKVKLGHYNSERIYYTLLFHEVGHNVLRRLGRLRQTYNNHHWPEENFCWEFSRQMCRLLDLPYSLTRELLSRLSGKLTDKLRERRNVMTEELFWQICVIEGLLFGFSYSRKTEFVWDKEGKPQVLVKE